MKKTRWTTKTFVMIGALAALNIILSLPGALLAGLTGMALFSAIGNSILIGISYSFVALLFRRFGAVTLWSFISGILAIPFPIAGPPGFCQRLFISSSGYIGGCYLFNF